MSRTHGAAAFVAATTLTLAGFTVAAYATGGQDDHKTAICHRTASDLNPYVYEEVDDHSLDGHYNNLPGHPAKFWKTAGVFRGQAHVVGDPRNDYPATTAADCEDTVETEPTDPPTTEPTQEPSETPTTEPTETPTETPATAPTETPTTDPTDEPSEEPTGNPRPPRHVHHDDPVSSPPTVIDAGL